MNSSYAVNHYSDVFKSIVSAFQPTACVELGVLEGYSAVAIGEGLKSNYLLSGQKGHLEAYDLFGNYPYRHSSMEEVLENVEAAGLSEWITIKEADAFLAHQLYGNSSVHFLHVDLSNTGETVRRIMEFWDEKMVQGGVICFEGGSNERDQVEWMGRYGAKPIKPELEGNDVIAEKYVFGTYFKFPSMTCLLKKR